MSTRAPWRETGRAGLFPAALVSLSRLILAMVLVLSAFPNGGMRRCHLLIPLI
jgi:hypothetical protein